MNSHRVPILMYHEVGHSDSPWCITPQQFEAQMAYLHEQGYTTLSLTQLQQKISQNLPLLQKSVVITFDDGRKGVHAHAFPILQRFGFTATIYIVSSWVEGQNIPAEESYSEFLTWDELQQLANANFEIGSHSFSHKNMSTLDAGELERELSEAEK
ncbi:MAG: polysaccharide deacetylase family protein, partial [Nanoarchaeota archaeon]|nr:polysaccharide deacetylase family protein [Nanoarchaeota archaeon]